jgi:hypothetical protein
MNPILDFIGTELLWLLIRVVLAILLPIVLLIATPVVLFISITQKKPMKQLYSRISDVWLDLVNM